jgi:hypothetical protein
MALGRTQRERKSSAHDLHSLGVLGIGSDHYVALLPSVPDDLGAMKLYAILLFASGIRVLCPLPGDVGLVNTPPHPLFVSISPHSVRNVLWHA